MQEDMNDLIEERTLHDFVRESNYIEGIFEVLPSDLDAHRLVLRDGVTVPTLKLFVSVVQPRAVLRDEPHLNVQVGSHVAPRGGPAITRRLSELVMETWAGDPFQVHRRYLNLHPFTDGNGRSARVVWLYMMLKLRRTVARGFMHEWYYQSLAHYDRTEGAAR